MQLNGGKLKEVQVSLLLSSRAEMQKVIEKARLVPPSAFMNKISAAPNASVLSAAHIANTFGKKVPEQVATPIIPTQPPVISLTNFLTKSMMQQNTQQPTPVPQAQQLNYMSAYQSLPSNDIPGLGAMPTTVPMTSGLSSLPMGVQPNAAAAAAYANYIATLTDPNLMSNYANQMSAGLTATPQEILRNVPTAYNTDPRGGDPRNGPRVDPRNHRSDPREQNHYRQQQNRSPERKVMRRSRSNSHDNDRWNDVDRDSKEPSSKRRTRFSAAVTSDAPMKVSPGNNSTSVGYSIPPPVVSNIWDKPPQNFAEVTPKLSLGGEIAYPNFGSNGNNVNLPTRNYQTENSSSNNFSSSASKDSASFGIGTCVKVSNVDSETFYNDLRNFFNGLPIGNNDIKFVFDHKNNRTGVVLIRFLSSDSKKKALTKSMWQLKSTQVLITSITEEEFESGLMNVKKDSRQTNYNSNRNDDRYNRNDRNDRRDRSDSRDRNDRNYNNNTNNSRNQNRNDGNNYRNNRYDDRQFNNRDQGGNSRQIFKKEEPEKPKEYKPDEKYTVLIIDDIPRTASESDIFEAFPNILSVTIARYTVYAKFTSHDAAKVTLENRFIHYIRNKRVFFEAGSVAQFDDVARKHGKQDNPDFKGNSNDENSNGDDDVKFHDEQMMNDDTNHSNNSDSRDNFRNNENSQETRDPRQRSNFNGDPKSNDPRNSNDRFGANNGQQGLKTDCVIMKNMEPDTKIEDVEEFYKDLGIYKMRVHILLDKKGWLIQKFSETM